MKRSGIGHLSSFLIFSVATRMVIRTAYTTVNHSVFSRVSDSPPECRPCNSLKSRSELASISPFDIRLQFELTLSCRYVEAIAQPRCAGTAFGAIHEPRRSGKRLASRLL